LAAARRLTKRSFREAERAFVAEGPQAVREALLAVPHSRSGSVNSPVRELFATDDALVRHKDIVALATEAGVPVHVVASSAMRGLTGTVNPQDIVAVCGFVDVPLGDALAGSPRLVAVLAHARDPGNVGTVIRTADAAGAGAVVLTGESVDVYNGKCVRASAGSVFHLPLSLNVDVAVAVDALRGAGLQVLAADASGILDLDEAQDTGRLAAPTAWVFGNEAWGLPESVRALADAVVRVPIHGRAESLNLATAAAICLYASARAARRV
jgi:RNA methyltransferase, TrmH family